MEFASPSWKLAQKVNQVRGRVCARRQDSHQPEGEAITGSLSSAKSSNTNGAVRQPAKAASAAIHNSSFSRKCYYVASMAKPVPRPKTAAERKTRVTKILATLDRMYPQATCALHHDDPWQLLVATILSAQCTDKRVNEVTPGLFRKYPTMRDFAAAKQEELARDIRSTGFFNNKSKSLIGAARKILEDFGGEIPRDIDKLLTVPGAARKTANVVLGTAFGITSGVVVDTHVQRLSRRLDLTKHTDPGGIEKDLMKTLPKEKWILFSHQIIHHGRALCMARNPKCAECALDPLCYAKDKTVSHDTG